MYLLVTLKKLHGVTLPDMGKPKPDSGVVSALMAMEVPDFDGNVTLAALRAEEWEARLLKRRAEIREEIKKLSSCSAPETVAGGEFSR